MTATYEASITGYTGNSPVSKELPKINELPTRAQQMAKAAFELIEYSLEHPNIHELETDPKAYMQRYKKSQVYSESKAWIKANSDQLKSRIAAYLAELYSPEREEIEKRNRKLDRARLSHKPVDRFVYRNSYDFVMRGVEVESTEPESKSTPDTYIEGISTLIVRQQYLRDLGQIVDVNEDGTDNAEEVKAAKDILGEDPFRTMFNQNILAIVMRAGRKPRPPHADEPLTSNHQSPSQPHQPALFEIEDVHSVA